MDQETIDKKDYSELRQAIQDVMGQYAVNNMCCMVCDYSNVYTNGNCFCTLHGYEIFGGMRGAHESVCMQFRPLRAGK